MWTWRWRWRWRNPSIVGVCPRLRLVGTILQSFLTCPVWQQRPHRAIVSVASPSSADPFPPFPTLPVFFISASTITSHDFLPLIQWRGSCSRLIVFHIPLCLPLPKSWERQSTKLSRPCEKKFPILQLPGFWVLHEGGSAPGIKARKRRPP